MKESERGRKGGEREKRGGDMKMSDENHRNTTWFDHIRTPCQLMLCSCSEMRERLKKEN